MRGDEMLCSATLFGAEGVRRVRQRHVSAMAEGHAEVVMAERSATHVLAAVVGGRRRGSGALRFVWRRARRLFGFFAPHVLASQRWHMAMVARAR